MKRINVIGTPGSGKSYLSEAISAACGLPWVKLDALRHGPGWTEVPDQLFEERVSAAVAEERWVIDGNYVPVRPSIWRRADTVIWTDIDKGVAMRQVIRRSFRDWIRRTETVPGNREQLGNFVKPWHPIRWTWAHHAEFRERETTWLADPSWAHLRAVHLRSRQDIDTFVTAVRAS